MAESAGLEWLTVGATVALVRSHHATPDSIAEALVQKVGKRDVVVDAAGRIEKFNLGRTWSYDDAVWLTRREGSWGGSTDLGPLDSPRAKKVRSAQTLANAVFEVRAAADKFAARSEPESARELRSAVDAYLELAEGVK